MRVVVTGGSGMLGHTLAHSACRTHDVWGSYCSHRVEIPGCRMFPLDVSDEKECRTQVNSVRPDVVVHTAGLTDVDECERQPAQVARINVQGTRILADVAERLGAVFIYISTDYVFDGERGGYSERDSPNPVNRYGESKLLGEEWVRRCCSRALILRTTMFGLKIPPRKGLIETLVDALRRGHPLKRFVDQYFTPLYTGQLSELILRLVDLGVMGLFHVGTRDKVSRLDFAQQVAEILALPAGEIEPARFRQIEGLARRPRDTSLLSEAVETRLGIQLPRVRIGLQRLKEDWNSLVDERKEFG